MKTMAIRGKVLFFIFVLMLVSGCSYNRESTRSLPESGVGCAKFMSDYTQYERDICSHD